MLVFLLFVLGQPLPKSLGLCGLDYKDNWLHWIANVLLLLLDLLLLKSYTGYSVEI